MAVKIRIGRHCPAGETPSFEKFDAYALKALSSGTASESQQIRALKWILDIACQVNENPFVAGSEHETAFNTGKAFVGRQIINICNMSSGSLEAKKNNTA